MARAPPGTSLSAFSGITDTHKSYKIDSNNYNANNMYWACKRICGIAEQDMVGIAAGLASVGKRPFVCAPASFLSARSFEQVKVDAAYSNKDVKLIGVSGGISYGALGESHYSVQETYC